MNKAHQIKLYPTNAQQVLLHKSFGVARHSYNWALETWKEWHEKGERPSAYSLIKHQNSIKKEQTPFYLEVSKTAPQYAIHNVEKAFKRFFDKKAKYPKFKKKGIKDSFVAVENKNQFKQHEKKIWLPRIGWVKCAEDLRFKGKVNNVVVKRIADMYFAVVNIELPNETPIASDNQVAIGVDLGIKTMMVLSDGTTFENPKALKNNLKQLKRLQRSLCRKQKGSNNRRKQQIKVARKHYRVSCIRKNAIHQSTSHIINNYDKIFIEDLNVEGMLKNHSLAQSISDVSFSEITRQLAYKAAWQGKEVVMVDRWFPSSKLCSCCGNKKEKLKLSERVYRCDNCGLEIDRDLNAAKNLVNYDPTQKTGESEACGADPNISSYSDRVAMKQELSINR